MGALRGFFRPEFLNRVDEFILFDPLSQQEIRQIVKLQVLRVAERLKEKKMTLRLTEAAVDYIANIGYDVAYGARPVKRAVQSNLETLIAKAILRSEVRARVCVRVCECGR